MKNLIKSAALLLMAVSISQAALKCPFSGVFPHPDDCTSMYTCRGSQQHGFVTETHTCPGGQAFSAARGRCVDSQLEPGCHTTARNLSSSFAGHPDCNDEALHCLDCSTLVFCTINENNEYENPEYINCGTDPLVPYCDVEKRQCTDVLPIGCPLIGYTCSGPGLFPDPYKCNLYHICYPDGDETYKYSSEQCAISPDLFYDTKEFKCRSATTEPCSIECGGVIGIIPYPNDDRYYSLCLPDKLEIQMCPGNYRFNGVNACDFTCIARAPGLYAHIEDCHKYHRCVEGSDVPLEESCPMNLAFNPISGACDTEEHVLCK